MNEAADKLDDLMNKVDSVTGTYELAEYYCKQVVPAMSEVRAAADHCEIIIGKDYWPLPSYSRPQSGHLPSTSWLSVQKDSQGVQYLPTYLPL